MAGKFSISLTAVDNASKTIGAVNRQLANLTAPVSRFQKQVSKFAEVSGIESLYSGFKHLGTGIAGAAMEVGKFAPALGAVASVASVAGVAALATSFARFGQQLGIDANRVQTSVGHLQALEGAAQLAGVSAGTMTQGMRALNDTIADAAGDRNATAASLFNQLHINLKNADGSLKTAAEIMPQVSDNLATMGDAYQRARLETVAMGGAGEALDPLLRRGAKGIGELTNQAARYGLITPKAVEASRQFEQAQAGLSLAVSGFGNSVAENVLPVITPLVDQMSDWIARNREWISLKIGEYIKDFGKWVSEIDWTALGAGISGFFTKVSSVVTKFGDWKTHIENIATGLGGPIVTGIGALITKIGELFKMVPPKWLDALLGVGLKSSALALDVMTGNVGDFIDQLSHLGSSLSPGEPPATPATPPAAPQQGVLGRIGSWIGQHMPSFGGRSSFSADTTITPEARGLLDTIADTESGGRYGALYGTKEEIRDFSAVPTQGQVIPSGPHKGEMSHAFGRYQFQPGTWQEAAAAVGATDIRPANQDRAAWWLAQRDYNARTGRILAQDLKSADQPYVAAGIGAALHGTWTSLPGGIEAGTDPSQFASAFGRHLAQEKGLQARGAPVNLDEKARGQTAAQPASAADKDDKLHITVDHVNPPEGTKVRVQGTDNLNVDQPRVLRSLSPMSLAG